jgi:hypothetical protein
MTLRRPGAQLLLVLLGAFVVTGCGGGFIVPGPNERPVADIRFDEIHVTAGESVELDATGSHDPDGDGLTYTWLLLAAPEQSANPMIEGSRESPTFTPDVPGTYVWVLQLRDEDDAYSIPDAIKVIAS